LRFIDIVKSRYNYSRFNLNSTCKRPSDWPADVTC